jgi:hypothetical protein
MKLKKRKTEVQGCGSAQTSQVPGAENVSSRQFQGTPPEDSPAATRSVFTIIRTAASIPIPLQAHNRVDFLSEIALIDLLPILTPQLGVCDSSVIT